MSEIDKLFKDIYVKHIALESPEEYKKTFEEILGDNNYKKIKRELLKYQIGKDPIDTIIVIFYGYIILSLKNDIAKENDMAEKEALIEVLQIYKRYIHKNDMKLILRNKNKIYSNL